MDKDAIIDYLTQTFEDVSIAEDSGSSFFSYDPNPKIQLDGWLPFATLVVSDAYDQASRLDRPSVFRLNIGVSPESYRRMFGAHPSSPGKAGVVDTGHNFAALDQIMPHPVYAPMSWVCVLNPGKETFGTVQLLLKEAYEIAVRRYEVRAERSHAEGIVVS